MGQANERTTEEKIVPWLHSIPSLLSGKILRLLEKFWRLVQLLRRFRRGILGQFGGPDRGAPHRNGAHLGEHRSENHRLEHQKFHLRKRYRYSSDFHSDVSLNSVNGGETLLLKPSNDWGVDPSFSVGVCPQTNCPSCALWNVLLLVQMRQYPNSPQLRYVEQLSALWWDLHQVQLDRWLSERLQRTLIRGLNRKRDP